MAPPALHGSTGEVWGQLKSSRLLKEPFRGGLVGANEETRGPNPGVPALGPPWPAARDS